MNFLKKMTLMATLASAVFTASGFAAEATYDFTDPKGTSGVAFVLDSSLEPLVGIVGGVQGMVTYDPAEPMNFRGSISVDMATVKMVNDTMVSHLKGAKWLGIDDETFLATMKFEKVTEVRPGDKPTLIVEAVLSFGAKQVPMTVHIKPTLIENGAAERGGAESGDLLVLRSVLELSRVDLGINPDMPTDKVGDSFMVMVPLIGYEKE